MIFSETTSVCPVCLKTLPAILRTAPDGVYMDKTCPDHGNFSALLWEGDFESYLAWPSGNESREVPINGCQTKKGCPYDCGLCEEHQSKGCCVLLELTHRCNLRCPVCFASAGDTEEEPRRKNRDSFASSLPGNKSVPSSETGKMSPSKESADSTHTDIPLEEIRQQYAYLMAHGGPFNIQLSGGEPTMRDDLPDIIRLGRDMGFSFFQLNTNGLRLAHEEGYAVRLKQAGLNTVFLQFDGVSDDVYEILRGRRLLAEKEKAIANCAAAGLGIVLVPVIAAGVNEHQVGDILRYALSHMPAVRGVHFQPLSYFGRCALPRPEKPITIPKMLRLMEEQTEGTFKAAHFTGGGAENPYCSFHATYRLLKDGSLKALSRHIPGSSGCCCHSSDESRLSVAEQWSGGEFNNDQESCCCGDPRLPAKESCCDGGSGISEDNSLFDTSSLDAFLEEARKTTFAVSGMVFMDAYNLDLARLRRCYICEVDSRFGMVPFCAYNLTGRDGRALYRNKI